MTKYQIQSCYNTKVNEHDSKVNHDVMLSVTSDHDSNSQ